MATPEQIRQKLEDMAKLHAPPVTLIARVKTVDEVGQICVLIDEDDQEIFNVRLRPIISNNKSFIQIPKLTSYVMAVRIEDDEDWMIIACDEVDKMLWKVGAGTYFELDDKVHIEAGGENLADLIDALFDAISLMVFVSPSGNTTALVNAAQFQILKLRFKTILK